MRVSGRLLSATKLRREYTILDQWSQRSRGEKHSAVLYPHLTDKEVQAEMAQLASNERKRAPAPQTLLKDHERGAVSPLSGVAQPDPRWQRKKK